MSVQYSRSNSYPEPLPSQRQKELVRQYQNGDIRAGQRVVETNMAWVKQYVVKYKGGPAEYQDIVQAGALGLTVALDRFDPDKGPKFLTYAKSWVFKHVTDLLGDSQLINMNLGTKDGRKLCSNMKKLEDKFGQDVDAISNELDISKKEVKDFLRAYRHSSSLDMPNEDGLCLYDMLPKDNNIQQKLEAKEELSALIEFGKGLSGRGKDIWFNRVMSDSPTTYKAIGERYGVSGERIRQNKQRLEEEFEDWADDRGLNMSIDELGS